MVRVVMRVVGVLILVVVCFVIWYTIAADYSDRAVSGRYRLAQDAETSTLVLRPDHTFQQELSRPGKTRSAAGKWHRIGEGGITFSKEFLEVSGQEAGADGTAYGQIHKRLGFLMSLVLSDHHVVWYGKVDSSSANTLTGTYKGDEGVPATLILRPDQTFEQTVGPIEVEKHAKGTWSRGQSGDILFSRDFLKTSGEALTQDERASAIGPTGANLQIEIAMTGGSGAPTFRKRQLPW